jgi:hypothetical protein
MRTRNIGEHFNRFEKMIQEAIATTIGKSYASATATPVPEITTAPKSNHVREIQQQNLEREIQRRHELSKFETILTTQETDTTVQLAQQSHAEITAKLQRTIEDQKKENHPTVHGIQKHKSQDI